MRRYSLLLTPLFLLALAACDGVIKPDPIEPGDTEFVSANPMGGNQRGGVDDTAGSAPGAGEEFDGGAGAAPERTVEEADIVRVEGNLLYVLNSYRGLQVIDLTNRDDPQLLGMAGIYGHPVEMYIRGNRAYVVVSNYYTYYAVAESDDGLGGFQGSQIRVLDISNPANPVVIGGFQVEGDITDTRIVGDVLYAVSNRTPWYYYWNTQDTADGTFVLSINIADPNDIHVVDEVQFDRNGWDQHVNVTPNAIHLASSGWQNDGYRTRIQYVDISDPAGDIVVGGAHELVGWVRDRWMLDEYQGVLRVVTAPDWRGTAPKVFTLSVQPGGTYQQLATTSIVLPRPESLTAVRFDGPRGYVVTFERVDPLFTLDLSDPTQPRQMGELEMPGWLDHIAPRGDRLVALGHDDSTGSWRLAVSLFDVSDLTAPTMLDRVTFGENWGWIPDERDNFDKVFKVLDDIGLVMVPFHSYGFDDTTGYWTHAGGVQLVDFTANDLVKRGLIDHPGYVRRALTYQDRILTVSDEAMQTVDATNRDAPSVTGEVELSRNVVDFVVMGEYGVQLVGDWYRGDTRIVVVPMTDYDLGAPVAEVQVTAPYGRMFVDGSYVYLVSQDWRDGKTQVSVVDLTNPASPAITGTVVLPQQVSYWGWGWGWYGGDELVQVGGDTLVFHNYRYWWRDCFDCGATADDRFDRLYIVDLSDKSNPNVANTVVLRDESWVYGLKAKGDLLFFTHFETAGQDPQGRPMSRYYLDRIDLTDPARPVRLPKVNIPGMVVDLSDDLGHVYTVDQQWATGSDSWQVEYAFNALELRGGTAILRDRETFEGYVNQILVRGSAAFFTRYRSWNDAATGQWHSESRLVAIDLTNPRNLRVADDVATPGQWGWLRAVEGNRAFIDLGWQGGLLAYDVSDLDNLTLAGFHRHPGWVNSIRVQGGTAFVALGYYGVQAIGLGTAQ